MKDCLHATPKVFKGGRGWWVGGRGELAPLHRVRLVGTCRPTYSSALPNWALDFIMRLLAAPGAHGSSNDIFVRCIHFRLPITQPWSPLNVVILLLLQQFTATASGSPQHICMVTVIHHCLSTSGVHARFYARNSLLRSPPSKAAVAFVYLVVICSCLLCHY